MTPASTKSGSETKQRIIRSAAELFRRQGYDGTGLNQILDEAGAPRGSLYFHFPGGKQQLAVEAVSQIGTEMGQGMALGVDSGSDVAEGVARTIEFIADDLERHEYVRGCPIGAVTLDAATSSDDVRQACRDVFEGWMSLFEQRLVAEGWAPSAARDEAILIVSSVEGALMLSRSRRDAEPLRAVARRLRSAISN